MRDPLDPCYENIAYQGVVEPNESTNYVTMTSRDSMRVRFDHRDNAELGMSFDSRTRGVVWSSTSERGSIRLGQDEELWTRNG